MPSAIMTPWGPWLSTQDYSVLDIDMEADADGGRMTFNGIGYGPRGRRGGRYIDDPDDDDIIYRPRRRGNIFEGPNYFGEDNFFRGPNYFDTDDYRPRYRGHDRGYERRRPIMDIWQFGEGHRRVRNGRQERREHWDFGPRNGWYGFETPRGGRNTRRYEDRWEGNNRLEGPRFDMPMLTAGGDEDQGFFMPGAGDRQRANADLWYQF